MPLVRTSDGSVRRMLLIEYARAGGQPWSVGLGLGAEIPPRQEEMLQAKKYLGNTWDGAITEIVMGSVRTYMRPYMIARAHEPDDGRRALLRLTHVAAYHALPIRRAWRTWREIAVTEGQVPLAWVEMIAVGPDGRVQTRRHPSAKITPAELTPVEDGTVADDTALLPVPMTRTPPKTKRPPTPEAPSAAEQTAFQREFTWWHECYTDAGLAKRMRMLLAISDNVVKPDPTFVPGAAAAEWRFGQADLKPGARGKIVRVDTRGRVSLAVPLREANREHVAVKFNVLHDYLKARDWPDEKTTWGTCIWGEDDESGDRPLIGSFSPNSKNCYDDVEKTTQAVQKEIDAGWLYSHKVTELGDAPFAQREWLRRFGAERLLERGHLGLLMPEWLVEHVAPFNTRPKPDGTVRLMGNPAWPVDGQDLEYYEGARVAPNSYRDLARLAAFEWASCESFGEGFAVIVAMSHRCGLQPRGACDDLRKWFRQIPIETMAQHRAIFMWGAERLTDRMSQMGRYAAAHGGQQVAFAVAAYVFEMVDTKMQRFLQETTCPKHVALRGLLQERREKFGGVPEQCSPFFMEDMQDDLGWVACSPELADIAWCEIARALKEDLGIQIAEDKREKYGSPQPVIVFMGGGFDARDTGAPETFLTDEKRAKWNDVVETWSGAMPGSLVPEIKLLATLGLAVFICKFLVRGRRYLGRGFHCLAARAGGWKPVSHGWLEDLVTFTTMVNQRSGVPPIVSARWWSPGALGCNSDASRSDVTGGWGFNVMHWWARGRWTERQLGNLDISTLELITVAFMVACVGTKYPSVMRVVVRCDNQAACDVINNHGASSPVMEAALRLLELVQQRYGIEVRAIHVAGERNPIADAFSRAETDEDVAAAVEMLRAVAAEPPAQFALDAEWESGIAMQRTLAAARRWRRTAAKRARAKRRIGARH